MKALNQISNLIILTLVNCAKDYPWASYIANSLSQFDLTLPELMQSKAKEISITDIEGIEQTAIEYYTWDEDEDGPIPGIKLFKDLNIYLEREFCEY